VIQLLAVISNGPDAFIAFTVMVLAIFITLLITIAR
jgi:hypothetical protein